MPPHIKEEFIKKSKEFNMYKYWENQKLEHEGMDSVHTQIDALSACLFLPDYLYEESFSDTGKQGMESMEEF